MLDLRCSCGKKIAEYDDTTISIMDKKCKTVTTLKVIDGKLINIGHRLKPIKVIEINNDVFTNNLYLLGEHIGIVIDNRMCINKQKVLDLVHDIELFEKMVKEYEKLPIKIMEIEYY